MLDWNNDNSIYVFTGIMTEQDRLDNIVTTSAWTIGFWNELSDELQACFDETLVYEFAKKRDKLLFEIKTKVEDTTPFIHGVTLLSDESSFEMENLMRSKLQTPEKIENILRKNIERTYLERIDKSLKDMDKENFMKETKHLQSFRSSFPSR